MNFDRRDWFACGALLALGAIAGVNLMAIPAFEDEATQLRWIGRALEAGEWLQPLAEGKPMEVWPMTILVRLGLTPLPAIRTAHVLAGMFGAVLTYLLARQVGSRAQAVACGVLFAVCPFVVYLQRIALPDGLFCLAGIAALVATLALLESPTVWRACALGLALVLVAFCKFPVTFIFALWLPLALLLMPAGQRRTLLRRPAATRVIASQFPMWLLALTVVGVVAVRAHQGKALGFGMQTVATIGLGLGESQGIAAGTGVPRPTLVGELTTQLSGAVCVFGLLGIGAAAIWGDWRHRWLILVGAVPMLVIGLVAHYWFSRYLLFTLPPLIVAAVAGWARVPVVPLAVTPGAGATRAVQLAVFIVCLWLMGQQSAHLILNPITARWSPLDRFQYFQGWGSGYGYPEAARFLMSAKPAPAVVFSLDGHSAYQLRTYLPPDWAQRVRPVVYGEDGRLLRTTQERVENVLAHAPVMVVGSPQLLEGYLASSFGPGQPLNLRPIAKFDKPGGQTQVALYEVTRR